MSHLSGRFHGKTSLYTTPCYLLLHCENNDTWVEHLVGSILLRVGPVCSIVLFLRFVTSKHKVFNRRDVLPWYLYSHMVEK